MHHTRSVLYENVPSLGNVAKMAAKYYTLPKINVVKKNILLTETSDLT